MPGSGRILAYLLFLVAACMVLFALYSMYVALTRKEGSAGGAMGILLMTLPTFIGIVILGTFMLAIREVIAWMVALEARQYEISKNLARW